MTAELENVIREIQDDKLLSYLFMEIERLKKFIDTNIQIKTCGIEKCKKQVLASEYTVIYPDKKGVNGVCNECWMKHYMPFTKEYNVHSHEQDGPMDMGESKVVKLPRNF